MFHCLHQGLEDVFVCQDSGLEMLQRLFGFAGAGDREAFKIGDLLLFFHFG